MAERRDDFLIAFRSAFLKKKDKQKFSLLTLIFLSVLVITLGSFNFKIIKITKSTINEIIYRATFLISIPENKIKKINIQIDRHLNLYKDYEKNKLELDNLKQKNLTNNFLLLENKRLKNLINENINSDEILAKVLIDKESPYLKSIILNKGTKDNVKIGMAVADGIYLVGKIIEVNYTNSRALLLSDLNSKIPVLLEPIEIQAVLSGTGKNHGTIEYTKEEYKEEAKVKEIIVYTSGFGEMFKSGMPVGKISNSNINMIDFFSDFQQLDYVRIITFKVTGKN
jgi:rod shape-determining protein MreC